jgi:hypothetical protein
MRAGSGIIFCVLLLQACVSNPPLAPQIQRISPEELERIMPKPMATLTLDDIVGLTKNGTSPDQIIAEIKASKSYYDLAPSQAVELSKQGVDGKVLDYMHSSRQAAIRDDFADEINKREKACMDNQERLRREYEWRSQPYYDPFWGYGYSPYWQPYPYYGFGFRYYRGW